MHAVSSPTEIDNSRLPFRISVLHATDPRAFVVQIFRTLLRRRLVSRMTMMMKLVLIRRFLRFSLERRSGFVNDN